MSKSELKTCPFCGGDAVLKKVSSRYSADSWGDSFQVECMVCGVRSATYDSMVCRSLKNREIVIEKDGRKDAIGAWNRRA